MNKIGNVEILGNIQISDSVYTASTLKEKLDNISNSNGSIYNVEDLLFKAPEISGSTQYIHLKIEFSTSDEFTADSITKTILTSDANTYTSYINENGIEVIEGLKVFTGMSMTGFPVQGLTIEYSKEVVKLNITNIEGNYYRFCWIVGDLSDSSVEPVASRYGFGQLNGIMNVFDDIKIGE